MQTYARQTLLFGEDESTSLQAASPASLSALPANAKARRTTATSGRKCLEQFGRFAPVGSWARTFSELLIGRGEWFSNRCALTWRLAGTKSNRIYFRLVPSALPTEGTDAGLLPTVQTQGLKRCEQGKTVFMPPGLLPTPTPMNSLPPKSDKSWEREMSVSRPGRTKPGNLRDIPFRAPEMLPTPKTSDCQSPGKHGKGGLDLRTAVLSQTGTNFLLNPLFAAEMMGFPVDWTVLPFQIGEMNPSKPTETLSCRR